MKGAQAHIDGTLSPDAAAAPPGRSLKSFARLFWWAALIRVVIAAIPGGFPYDQACFKAWGISMIKGGPARFYELAAQVRHCDYPPLYMYWVGFWDWLYTRVDPSALGFTTIDQFMVWTPLTFWNKLPVGMMDLVNAWLAWSILSPRIGQAKARPAALILLFNPVFFYDSVYWGQLDGLTFTFMLLLLKACLDGNMATIGSLGALSLLLKPQGIFFAPFVVMTQWFRRKPWTWILALGSGLVASWLVLRPFWPDGHLLTPIQSLLAVMSHTAEQYPYGSNKAFNLHALLGLYVPDSGTWLGVSQKLWGLLMLGAFQVFVGWRVYRQRDVKTLLLGAALSVMAFYMLATRMHERYILPGLSLLVLAYAANPRLKVPFRVLCVVTVISLVFAQDSQVQGWLRWAEVYKIFVVANLGAFVMLVREFLRAPEPAPALSASVPAAPAPATPVAP